MKNFPDKNALADPDISLHTFDRRYIFFKKLFRQFPSKYGILFVPPARPSLIFFFFFMYYKLWNFLLTLDHCFLKEWHILLFITHRFCGIVRHQLISIMDAAAPDLNITVKND
jgi:hypothetical protein